MFDKLSGKLPAHIKLLFKLYGLNLIVFFVIRLLFYYYNQSSDVSDVAFLEKVMAFRMGLEFDTAVYCWIAFFPTVLWSIAYFFNHKQIYNIGYYGFLFLQLLYHLICIADIPYFKQFGNHINKGAFLWSESPSFAVGVIFGSFSYWGFFIVFFITTYLFIRISKKCSTIV